MHSELLMARRVFRSESDFSYQVLAAVALCLPACGGLSVDDDDSHRHDTTRDTNRDPPPPDVQDPPDDPDVVLNDVETIIPLMACWGETADLLDNLKPIVPIDFLAWAAGSSATIIDSRHEECETGLGGATTESCGTWRGPLMEPQEYLLDGDGFLIWSQGDTFGSITNKEQLLEFLGTIDTAHEARLVLQASPEQSQVDFGCAREGGSYCFEYERNEHGSDGCDSKASWYDSYCVAPNGSIESERTEYFVSGDCLGGRRPDGLECDGAWSSSYFANLYRLETAAALAFSQLAAELRRLGAPASLVSRAEQAALDECEHSLMAAREARRGGESLAGGVAVASVLKPSRSILELALENAEEGLVRESFGAAQAELTARLATTPRWRRFWGKIARDELGHAELSRDMGAWLWSLLSHDERILVGERRKQAVLDLERELGAMSTNRESRAIGLPSARQNRLLFSHLRATLVA